MPDEHKCVKIAEFENLKTNQLHLFTRISKVEEKADILYKIATSVEVMGTELKEMRKQSERTETKINTISEEFVTFKTSGSKKWDNFVWWAFILLMGYVMRGFIEQLMAGV